MGSASSSAALTNVVATVLELCSASIARTAAEVERIGVQRSTIDALAACGALGITMPVELGGLGADGEVQREVAELLAGSDASTWFCWAQHHTPSRVALESGWIETASAFATGAQFAGVAFAHVRRPGPPNPVATRADGGWLLNGTLDWVTSWDIADQVLVVARGEANDADAYVHMFLPTVAADGMTVGDPLQLLAMGGTHTRPITFRQMFVPDSRVVAIVDRAQWHARDDETSAGASPAVFGLIRASIAELSAVSVRNGERSAARMAEALTREATDVRASAYAATELSEQVRLRAHSLDLLCRATDAVVNAYAGSAMLSGHVAGRRVREARFMLVQAQTARSRTAWVDRQLSASL